MTRNTYDTLLEIEGVIANQTEQLVFYTFGPHADELEISSVGIKAEKLIKDLCAKVWEDAVKAEKFAHDTGAITPENPYAS